MNHLRYFCLVFAMPLCASVYLCLVVTCWERTHLLALVCGKVIQREKFLGPPGFEPRTPA